MSHIPESVDFWEERGLTQMRFIAMVVRNWTNFFLSESIYGVRSDYYKILDDVALDVIANERRIVVHAPCYNTSPVRKLHPGHFIGDGVISSHPEARSIPTRRENISLGPYPGMPTDCRQPFVAARITAGGEVRLCSKFKIGHLAENDFADIWYGEEAARVRRSVIENPSVCATCDYYRFCLKSDSVDLDDPRNYFDQFHMERAFALLKAQAVSTSTSSAA